MKTGGLILTMNVNNFNIEFWTGKTFEEFFSHESHNGLSKDELMAIFLYINPPKEKIKKEKKPKNG